MITEVLLAGGAAGAIYLFTKIKRLKSLLWKSKTKEIIQEIKDEKQKIEERVINTPIDELIRESNERLKKRRATGRRTVRTSVKEK